MTVISHQIYSKTRENHANMLPSKKITSFWGPGKRFKINNFNQFQKKG